MNVKNLIRDILKKSNIKKEEIFGSYARGEEKRNSDVDILIEFDGSLFEMVGLRLEFEKRLKKKIDLVSHRELSPHLKKYIIQDGVRII